MFFKDFFNHHFFLAKAVVGLLIGEHVGKCHECHVKDLDFLWC